MSFVILPISEAGEQLRIAIRTDSILVVQENGLGDFWPEGDRGHCFIIVSNDKDGMGYRISASFDEVMAAIQNVSTSEHH